jgi:hypothetical protein
MEWSQLLGECLPSLRTKVVYLFYEKFRDPRLLLLLRDVVHASAVLCHKTKFVVPGMLVISPTCRTAQREHV